jgi:uncharacterized protein (DUF983 family)
MPLDGCPDCGYPYEREPGYFLLSIFAINYGVGAMIGLVLYLIFDFWVKFPIWLTLVLAITPIPIFNLLFARHSKAFFIAFDLFFDPHTRDEGDGDQPAKLPNPSRPKLDPVKH